MWKACKCQPKNIAPTMSSGFKSLPLEFWLTVKRGSQIIWFTALPWQRGTPEVRKGRFYLEGRPHSQASGPSSAWVSISHCPSAPLIVIMDNPECPGKVSCEDTHARPGSWYQEGKRKDFYILHPASWDWLWSQFNAPKDSHQIGMQPTWEEINFSRFYS